jgi:pimeloyl-ACP methyl ester carboxylesterase
MRTIAENSRRHRSLQRPSDAEHGKLARHFLVASALILTLAGCSTVTVRPAHTPDLLQAFRTSLLEDHDLSPRTLQTLRQLDLEATYQKSPLDAFGRLQNLAVADRQPDRLFALAELSYLLGRQAENRKKPEAVAYYYFCAGYAYHYLFDEPSAKVTNEHREEIAPVSSVPLRILRGSTETTSYFDPRFRLACDLYNSGLAKCLRAAQRSGRLDPTGQLHVPKADGNAFTLQVIHQCFTWRPDEFGPLLFCSDYQVEGLQNLYHSYGLGVPLIGSREPAAPGPAHAFYPRAVDFPVTAFFRFDGTVAELGACHCGQLELYNPLAVQSVDVKGRPVPLETDLTTPLAYYLSHSDLDDNSYAGFLRPDEVQKRSGVYMFEPYQPGKIPVLMVHGILSSPVTWAPMFNDLRADPVLRERYQFWFYLYPTANPYLLTAADLRQTMAQLRVELDPHHQDEALDRMVLVGHSMGGIVSHLLTIDSGDAFWRLVSSEPFDSLSLASNDRAELQRIFFFEQQPSVSRVIFLGTPHHGSDLSPTFPARFAERFVRFPTRFIRLANELSKANPKAWPALQKGSLPTSVEMLKPGSPALELIAYQPEPGGVHYHSIIGELPAEERYLEYFIPGGTTREKTDGVVTYASAHLDSVDSEIVVPADHLHVHHHPLAVQEVKRILLEHLRSPGGVQRVGGVAQGIAVPK